jgi:hypothetical protein
VRASKSLSKKLEPAIKEEFHISGSIVAALYPVWGILQRPINVMKRVHSPSDSDLKQNKSSLKVGGLVRQLRLPHFRRVLDDGKKDCERDLCSYDLAQVLRQATIALKWDNPNSLVNAKAEERYSRH